MFIRRLRQDEFKAGQSFVADTFHHRLVNLKQDGQNSRQTQLATPEGTWVSQNKFEQASTQNTKAKIGLEFGDCLTHLVIWGQPRSYTQLPNKKGISISISQQTVVADNWDWGKTGRDYLAPVMGLCSPGLPPTQQSRTTLSSSSQVSGH